MRKKEIEEDDLYKCRREIMAVLREYNCVIESDDYHSAWLRDKDTYETTSVNQ